VGGPVLKTRNPEPSSSGAAFISLKKNTTFSFDPGTREPAKDAVRSTSSSHEQVRFD
jgi:hypothetical protein